MVLSRLPKELEGYRIAHLSDLHIGALASGARHVRRMASTRPDLFVITGDLIDTAPAIERCASLLGALEAPDGVFCVLGNHDHRTLGRHSFPTVALIDALAARGVRTLVNEALPIERNGERFWLVGVDDPHKGLDDAGTALAGVPPQELAFLLAHSPDVFLRLPAGRVDLAFTGHCHGGQVRTPWGPIVTRTDIKLPDVLGLQWIGGTPVNMSGGLGSTIPLRVLCPPEATILELSASPGPG